MGDEPNSAGQIPHRDEKPNGHMPPNINGAASPYSGISMPALLINGEARHDSGTSTNKPPITRHQHLTTLAHWACVVCSIGAGIGLTAGLISPNDGPGGLIVPFVSGAVLAFAVAIGWHKVITCAARVRTSRGYLGTVAGAALVGVFAVASSSWGIATALSGRAALREHQSVDARAQADALDAAWAEASAEYGVIEAMRDAEGKWKGLAQLDEKGGVSGRHGSGLVVALFDSAGDRYSKLADRMQAKYDEAEHEHQRCGDISLLQFAAIGKDADAFTKYAHELRSCSASLNAFHLTQLVGQGDSAEVNVATDTGTIKRIKGNSVDVTADVKARVKAIASKRHDVSLPNYIPIEARQAVWDYGSTAAIGGWVTAVGIDLFPWVFIIILLATAQEPLLLRNIPMSETPPDYDNISDGSTHGTGTTTIAST